ncbi:MAG: Tic22 family protein, partial [Pleurocapsa sp.]
MRSLFIGTISSASILLSSYSGIALAQLIPQEVAQLDEDASLDFILEKLNPVPVFVIADENGSPLIATKDDDSKITGVFISQTDANRFVEQLKIKDPEIAAKVKVIPTPLGGIYKLSESAKDESNPLQFAYIPEGEAVNSAKTIIGEQNEDSDPLEFEFDSEYEQQVADLAETNIGE